MFNKEGENNTSPDTEIETRMLTLHKETEIEETERKYPNITMPKYSTNVSKIEKNTNGLRPE